jgi:hypothetical protein
MDYAIVDLWSFQQYQAAFEDDRDRLQTATQAVQRMLNAKGSQAYGLIDFQDGVLLLQRGVESDGRAIDRWEEYQ